MKMTDKRYFGSGKMWPPTENWVEWYSTRPRDTQCMKNMEALRVAVESGVIRAFDSRKDINRNHWKCNAAHALGLTPILDCPANGKYYFCTMGGGLDHTIPIKHQRDDQIPKGENFPFTPKELIE